MLSRSLEGRHTDVCRFQAGLREGAPEQAIIRDLYRGEGNAHSRTDLDLS